jgi:hypothetical protein
VARACVGLCVGVAWGIAWGTAWGQGAVQQTGPVAPNTPAMWAGDRHLRQGAGAAGDIDGKMIKGGFSAVGKVCAFSDTTDKAPVATLCLNPSGTITYNGTEYPIINSVVAGLPIVLNKAALSALATTPNAQIWRIGYNNPGDVPPLIYTASNAACTLNAGAGDNGSQVTSADGKCWIASPDAGGMDVRQWGARDDAVPGPVGQACVGIAGTDSTNAFRAAIAYAMASGARIVAGGTGKYRLNAVIDILPRGDYWTINTQRPPELDFTQPIVTCGSNAAFHIKGSSVLGLKISIAALIGPGAGSSAPVAGSGAENAGILLEAADGHRIDVGSVMDYTYDILLDGSYANTLHVGTAIAAYKAIYLRDGFETGYQSSANRITFENVGGIYTANNLPSFVQTQARGSYWGIHLAGNAQGNVLQGGAAQYAVKGTTGINLQVDGNYNYIDAWLEGHQGANGQDLVVNGSNNNFNLSNMASPSNNQTKHITVSGLANWLWGPRLYDTSQGTSVIQGNNYVNGDPVPVVYPPAVSCISGALGNSGAGFTSNARYKVYGSVVWMEITWTITSLGTCAGGLQIDLPLPPGTTYSSVMSGRNATTSVMLQCFVDAASSASLRVQTSTGGFPTAAGQTGVCSGSYNAE